jgi:uncharacterized protein with FMN-binding domain
MTARPRTRALSIGIASLGLLALAGCAAESSVAATAAVDGATYADGTYTAEGSYQAPSGTESVTVELTVADNVVTAVTAIGDATDREAQEYQQRFSSGISAEVVGKDLATLSVSRVAGSSLTSAGFDSALDDIRSQAG